jgi:hypothetical protein
MKKIFLAAGIMMAATATFANSYADNYAYLKGGKAERVERRASRREASKDRRAERQYDVSDRTKIAFAADFPDARNIYYLRDNIFDEVSFTSGNEKLRAYYDYDSKLVGTTQIKSFADLPASGQKEIRKQYAGYNVAAVIKYNDNADNDRNMILYGMDFNDDNNYFVELKNGKKTLVVKVSLSGDVSYFKQL